MTALGQQHASAKRRLAELDKGDPVLRLQASVARRLAAARERAKISQATVADRAGVGRRSVVNLETGADRVPSLRTIVEVAEVLGLSVRVHLVPKRDKGEPLLG